MLLQDSSCCFASPRRAGTTPLRDVVCVASLRMTGCEESDKRGRLKMGNSVTRKAYAKVNLVLDVLSERPDGYHDVRMVMQNLDLYDTLTFELLPEEAESPEQADLQLSVTLGGDLATSEQRDATIKRIPTDERNLIIKAVRLMYKTYNLKRAMHISLEKCIPVEAGMAGGSTNAAAAFHAVNELFGLNLSLEELMALGVKIGADVPFCIYAKTALAEGIGEKLTPVAPLPDCHILVAKPPVTLSTKEIYTNLELNGLEHPDVDAMVRALEQGDRRAVAERLANVLETVSVKVYREIEAIKSTMMICHAEGSIMTGSGPTVFGIFATQEHAQQAYESIKKQGITEVLVVTKPV